MMLLTVKRMPIGWEKLYLRAVLIFLLMMGLTVGQLFQKHFWIFLTLVMAGERIAHHFAEPAAEMTEEQSEEQLLPEHQLV
jgi:hypothetical protein